MKFHIITAVSRPEFLPVIADDLSASAINAGVDIAWHLRFNLERNDIGGQRTKNEILDTIPLCEDFVWFLDDDNTVHPLFLKRLRETIQPETLAVVVNLDRLDGRQSVAIPENVKPGSIDNHQVALRRDFIGSTRIPERFDGDGLFFQTLFQKLEKQREMNLAIFLQEPLAWHNYLTGEDAHE